MCRALNSASTKVCRRPQDHPVPALQPPSHFAMPKKLDLQKRSGPSLPAFDSCSQAPLLARFTALYERKPNYHSTASSQLSRLDLGVRPCGCQARMDCVEVSDKRKEGVRGLIVVVTNVLNAIHPWCQASIHASVLFCSERF